MSITIPFRQTDRQSIETLPDEQQALYLAALATYRYLKRIGMPAEEPTFTGEQFSEGLPAGILEVVEVGYLRCCPVEGDNLIALPPTCHNSIGQVLVALSQDQMYGEVFGFWAERSGQSSQPASSQSQLNFRYRPSQEDRTVSNYQSLEDLIDAIWEREPMPEAVQEHELAPDTVPVTLLRQWLDGIYEKEWQSSADALPSSRLRFKGNPRGDLSEDLTQFREQDSHRSITRVKRISQPFNGQILGLRLWIRPTTNDSLKIKARLMLFEANAEACLPIGIQFTLLNSNGEEKLRMQAENNADLLDIDFQALPNMSFSFAIVLGEIKVIERFQS